MSTNDSADQKQADQMAKLADRVIKELETKIRILKDHANSIRVKDYLEGEDARSCASAIADIISGEMIETARIVDAMRILDGFKTNQ